MKTLKFKSRKQKEVLDITDQLEKFLHEQHISDRAVHLVLKHTTAALTTADLDPGTDLDMLDAFEKLIPQLNFRHPHNPSHTPDHILSSLIGTTLTLIVVKGKLDLGTWQRVVLIEFDGPREREIVIYASKL